MKVCCPNRWDLTLAEAVALQRELASRVETGPALADWETVAAADVSHEWRGNHFHAGVVVLRRRDWTVIERRWAEFDSTFPYHSGLLAFREAPALLEAFAKVKTRPDVVLIDGQGYSHPRRCGLASHVGLCLEPPTIGCAKTRLTGAFDEPGPDAADASPLLAGTEVIGSVVRSRRKVKPLFVSIGNRIDLASAVRIVLECCRGYRVPEPLREAHRYVNALRRGEER